MSTQYQPKPEWLRIQLNSTEQYKEVSKNIRGRSLHTVCEEAKCPNQQECWGTHGTATFMILGDTCTRRCRFCAVKTGLPGAVDYGEPDRVGESVAAMDLNHVVITMVNRDDLKDGGADMMARTVVAIRKAAPKTSVEVLSSDLMGDRDSIAILAQSEPDIMSHNLETTRRLTPLIRSRSDYDRSLRFLELSREIAPHLLVKSSIMLGLGETYEEICQVMDDLRAIDVHMMNLGQYLQPSKTHAPVVKYWTPGEFAQLKAEAMKRGFTHVESGPLVRSSYHAGDSLTKLRSNLRKLNHPLYRDNPELG